MSLPKTLLNEYQKQESCFIGNHAQASLDKSEAYKRASLYLDKAQEDWERYHLVTKNVEDALYWLYLGRHDLKSAHILKKFLKEINEYSLKSLDNAIEQIGNVSILDTVAKELPLEEVAGEFLGYARSLFADESFMQCATVMPACILYYLNEGGVSDLEDAISLSRHTAYLDFEYDINDDLENFLTNIYTINLHAYEQALGKFRYAGMPSKVAMRLSENYLNAKDTRFDRNEGTFWLAYAMYTGDCKAYSIAPLYLISLFPESPEEIEAYKRIFFNGYLISRILSKEPKALSYLVSSDSFLYDYAGKKRHIGDDLIYNCLLSVEYAKKHFDDDNNKDQNKLEDELFLQTASFEIIKRMATKKSTPSLAGALVLAINLSSIVQRINIFGKLAEQKVIENVDCKDTCEFLNILCRNLNLDDNYYAHKALIEADDFTVSDANESFVTALASMGDARASFCLCGLNWDKVRAQSDFSKKMLVKLWDFAAQSGDGMGWFNKGLAALLADDDKEAINSANNALKCNISSAYFILYKAYADTNLPLACTYLRYAKEYLFPPACEEFEFLKRTGKYKPLEFLDLLEQMEEYAKNDSAACLFMALCYSSSGLLPADPYKNLSYVRKSAVLGKEMGRQLLGKAYSFFFDQDKNNLPLPSVSQSLNVLSGFVRRTDKAKEEALQNEKVFALARKIFDALKKGESSFEKFLFSQVVYTDFFSDYNCKKPRGFYNNYKEYLLNMRLREFFDYLNNDYIKNSEEQFGESYKERLGILNDIVESFNEEDFLPYHHFARALNALRPVAVPVNYKLYRQEIIKAGNSQIPHASFMQRLCTDAGFFAAVKENALTQNKSECVIINATIQ